MLSLSKKILNKKFFKNFFSLTIFQIIEVLIPLITIPIIIAKVGISNFGLINIAFVFCVFFQTIINYGFNTLGVRDIAVIKTNKKAVSQIFNSIFQTKIYLGLVSFILLYLCIELIPYFKPNKILYIVTFIYLFVQSLIPTWYFQGIEKSEFLAISNFIGKVVYLLLIIFMIKLPDDYILIPLYNLISFTITLSVLVYIAYKKFDIRPIKISISDIKNQLLSGKYMFLSEVKLYFLSYFNIFIMGLLVGDAGVGYFVGAEKILRGISAFFNPILNSLFPIISSKLKDDFNSGKELLYKIAKYALLILAIFCALLLFCSNIIVLGYLGSEMRPSVEVFKILAFIPLLSFFDVFWGKIVLVSLKKEKILYRIILFVTVLNILIFYLLTKQFGYIGSSIAILISQTTLTTLAFYYSKKIINDTIKTL